jgi:hypothetical protein
VPFTVCGAGAPYGSVCAHTCNAGYVPLSGTGTSTCNGDAWNDPPQVCVPTCPDLPGPDFAVSCAQSIYTESFSGATSVSNAWVSLMENFPSLGPYVFWANSAMQISAPPGIFPLGIIAVTTSQAIAQWSGAYSISCNIYTSDVAGLVWEAVDPQSEFPLAPARGLRPPARPHFCANVSSRETHPDPMPLASRAARRNPQKSAQTSTASTLTPSRRPTRWSACSRARCSASRWSFLGRACRPLCRTL